MKSYRVGLILFIVLFLLLLMIGHSFVEGEPSSIVRNSATMTAPYETGNVDNGESDGRRDAQADSAYNTAQGLAYASAFASKASNAWAYSCLQAAFEIIHSSNYRITFSFNYKGLINITGVDPSSYSTANARVNLTAYLIRRDGGEIIYQKTETIADVTENFAQIIIGEKDIAFTIALEENNIYDWRAELRTEASANNYFVDTAQATADFYDTNQGYQAKIVQVLVEDLNPDYNPPTTTYSPSGTQGENDWFTSSVTISLSATDDIYGVDYINQRVNGGSWTHYTSPFSITSEGTNTVDFYSVDKAGNTENIQSVNIKIDRNPPTGQVRINNNALYTSSEEVSLTTSTQDGQGSGVTQMRFRNEGENYKAWIPYTTSSTPWTLQKGDGNKRVYAQFKDKAGNVSPETYDEIILDTEPPMTSALLSGILGENDWFISSVTMSLSSVDNYGINYTNYRINNGTWNRYTSSFSVSSEDTNTVDFYSVDKAGNTENIQSVNIKIDKATPTASVLINNGDTYTFSTMVTLNLNYTDTASGVSEVRYSNDGSWDSEPWETPPTPTKLWNLTSGDGKKTVYYQTKDYAGKISLTAHDDIILDTEAPSASIVINEDDKYTNSTSVILYLQYSDNIGIDLVRYSNDGVSYTEWEKPSETKKWSLLPGDGPKTVYAHFLDLTGFNSIFVSDTIILDTTPPTGSIKINDGAATTTSTTVTITPNATDANGVAKMRFSNDGGNWSDWMEVETRTWNLTSEVGVKTVFAQFKDNAELISQTYNATINLVKPEPTPAPTPLPPQQSPTPSEMGKIIVYVKNENNSPINGALVTSTTQPTGQSPLSGITDQRGSVTFNDVTAGSYSFHASKSGFSANDVQVTARSQQITSITIILREDRNKPTVSVTVSPEDPVLPPRTFTITAEDDIQGSGIAKVTLYVDDVPVAIWTTAGTHNYDAGFYSIGTHTYYVEAVDSTGNSARYPALGNLKFTIVEGAYLKQTELWKLIGVVLVLANGTALLFFSLKRKKGKP